MENQRETISRTRGSRARDGTRVTQLDVKAGFTRRNPGFLRLRCIFMKRSHRRRRRRYRRCGAKSAAFAFGREATRSIKRRLIFRRRL